MEHFNPYAAPPRPPVKLSIDWPREGTFPEGCALAREQERVQAWAADIGAAGAATGVHQRRIGELEALIASAGPASDFAQIAAAEAEIRVLERVLAPLAARQQSLVTASVAARETYNRAWNELAHLRREIEDDARRGLPPSDRQRAAALALAGVVLPE